MGTPEGDTGDAQTGITDVRFHSMLFSFAIGFKKEDGESPGAYVDCCWISAGDLLWFFWVVLSRPGDAHALTTHDCSTVDVASRCA